VPNRNVSAHLALFVVALIYAANYTIAKVVMDTGILAPSAFIVLRLLGGVAVIWCLMLCTSSESVAKKDHFRLIGCGLTGCALNQLFFFEGLHRTSPIYASLIMTTTPIIVLILGALVYRYPIKWHKWLGVFLGFSGAIFFILKGQNSIADFSRYPEMFKGNLFILINATSYAIYLILVKSLMIKYEAITVIRWVFLYGLFFVLPIGGPQVLTTAFTSLTVQHWMSIGFVIVFVTILAYGLNAYAMRTVKPSVVGTYIYLQPLLASLIAIVFRGEILTVSHVVVGIIICLGVLLVSTERLPIHFFQKK